MSILCKNIQEDKQVPVSTITIYLGKLETKKTKPREKNIVQGDFSSLDCKEVTKK